MIHFSPSSADGLLLAELKDTGILNPGIIDKIDAAMGRPEIGTLDQVLAAGAALICENEWLTWLIRRHGCHRVGRPVWEQTTADPSDSPCFDGNVAYRSSPDGRFLVAVTRPDRKEATVRRLACEAFWVAATLREIAELRAPRLAISPFDLPEGRSEPSFPSRGSRIGSFRDPKEAKPPLRLNLEEGSMSKNSE